MGRRNARIALITRVIPTAEGDLLHYSAVAWEPLGSASKAPAVEVAASTFSERAAALAVLGLELWGGVGRRGILKLLTSTHRLDIPHPALRYRKQPSPT